MFTLGQVGERLGVTPSGGGSAAVRCSPASRRDGLSEGCGHGWLRVAGALPCRPARRYGPSAAVRVSVCGEGAVSVLRAVPGVVGIALVK